MISRERFPMIHNEDITTLFDHPADSNKLILIEKANMSLMANFLKILSVVDFSNMSFKEVSLLAKEVKTFLNQES